MAATFPILNQRVEEGTKNSLDVKRIQQLLVRVKKLDPSKITSNWDPTSVAAWVAYQKEKGWSPANVVEPLDTEDRLGKLAGDAGVLLKYDDGLRGLSGVTAFTNRCIAEAIPYGWKGHGGTKMAWGFDKRRSAIVFTLPGSRTSAEFDTVSTDPRAVNCCSFANLLLAIWTRGDVHGPAYSSGQGVGGDGPQIGERYGLAELTNKAGEQVFSNLDDLKAQLKKDRIYHFALCRDAETGLYTKHDTILINGTIYQANVPAASPNPGAVYTHSLDYQWKHMKVKRARVFGPGPH